MASYADRLPAAVRRHLDLVCHGLAAAYLAMFLYGALRFAIPSVQLLETSGRAWDVPIPAFLKSHARRRRRADAGPDALAHPAPAPTPEAETPVARPQADRPITPAEHESV